jgi:cell division GTPase FtsZ
VRKLHARNAMIVLGKNLDDPVDFIICWTPGGTGSGGTGQALRIARAYGIPVYDLGDKNGDL